MNLTNARSPRVNTISIAMLLVAAGMRFSEFVRQGGIWAFPNLDWFDLVLIALFLWFGVTALWEVCNRPNRLPNEVK